MTHPAIRFACWAPIALSCVLAACAAKPSPPEAFVSAIIGSGMDPAACNFASDTTLLAVGSSTTGQPTTVGDGNQQQGQGKVSVDCTVASSRGGFDLHLKATEQGPQGESTLIITSPQGQGAVTPMGGQVTGVWESPVGSYYQSNCTLSFTYGGQPVPASPPVAAGRIWGHISCPNAQLNGQTYPTADGGAATRYCDNEADFLFQYCGQ